MENEFIRVLKLSAAIFALSLPLYGQQDKAFFRVVSPTNSVITAFSGGTMVWTNAATGVTCMIQRATTLIGPSNWVDYVQHDVTDAMMATRLFDPNPPEGTVLIPAGMNVPDSGAYLLTVPNAFYMDVTEVTKAQWDTVYNWAVTNDYSFDNVGYGKAPNHPVHTINWYDCVKWCNARSEMNGRIPAYMVNGSVYKSGQCVPIQNLEANGYQLPTTTEEGYAARGGLIGKNYPWGNDPIDFTRANCMYLHIIIGGKDDSPYNDGIQPYTSPVGSFAANGYGCMMWWAT